MSKPLVGDRLWAWHVVTDPNEPLPVLPSGWTLATPATGPDVLLRERLPSYLNKPAIIRDILAALAREAPDRPGSDWTDPKG